MTNEQRRHLFVRGFLRVIYAQEQWETTSQVRLWMLCHPCCSFHVSHQQHAESYGFQLPAKIKIVNHESKIK